jgi:hypothetical protein
MLTQNFTGCGSDIHFGWTVQQSHHLLGPQNAIGGEGVCATLSYDYVKQESSLGPGKGNLKSKPGKD